MYLRAALAVVLVLATACAGPSATPGRTPSPTAPPAATASPAATAPPSPIVLPSFAQVSAPSADVVWVLVGGSRLFRSTDRGTAWVERPIPPAARMPAVAFVSGTEGWLLSSDVGSPQCASRPGAIWHTTDGAARWELLALTGVRATVCDGTLSFTDARHGFVAALDEKDGPVILRSADGGRTWAASGPIQDPPGLPMQGGRADLRFGRVRAFGATLLVTASVPAPAGPSTHVYRSQDGGATWTHASAVPSEGALAIVTATRWLRFGPAGTSFESIDAGASWHAFASDHSQAAPIAPEIVFGDALVGYATVRGGLQRTVDGGARWTQLRTPGTE